MHFKRLKQAIEKHLAVTKEQVTRVQEAGKALNAAVERPVTGGPLHRRSG